MADKSISELPTINAVTGDEYLYGIQSDGDVKIVADDLVDYILNTYEFNSDVTNANVIAGKINSLRTLTNTADLADIIRKNNTEHHKNKHFISCN